MDIEVLPSIPSNGDWVLKGQNGNPYWREDVKPDTDLSDKFAPLLGEGWAEKGQFAFGPGSKAQFTKENPPAYEVPTEPILFNATATAEGVTQELEDLPCLIIDPSQGASASVTYAGQTYEMPVAPEGAEYPYVVAYIFPKSDEYPNQVVPAAGRTWYSGLFEVFKVTEVPGGWLAISYLTQDPGGALPPILSLDDVGGVVLVPYNIESFGTSYALGPNSTASGHCSVALGPNSTASGSYSAAIGAGSTASGGYSTASGEQSTAIGAGSTASGGYSTASGDYSTASGQGSTASGGYSTASGGYSTASGYGSAAIGYRTIASGDYSTALGIYNANDATKMLIIGNGTSSTDLKNIFTIDYNGKPDSAKIPSVNGGDLVMLGTASPTTKPAFAGQIYLDSTNKKLYVAKSATATTDWVPIN